MIQSNIFGGQASPSKQFTLMKNHLFQLLSDGSENKRLRETSVHFNAIPVLTYWLGRADAHLFFLEPLCTL